jgi:hypothetical protein
MAQHRIEKRAVAAHEPAFPYIVHQGGLFAGERAIEMAYREPALPRRPTWLHGLSDTCQVNGRCATGLYKRPISDRERNTRAGR